MVILLLLFLPDLDTQYRQLLLINLSCILILISPLLRYVCVYVCVYYWSLCVASPLVITKGVLYQGTRISISKYKPYLCQVQYWEACTKHINIKQNILHACIYTSNNRFCFPGSTAVKVFFLTSICISIYNVHVCRSGTYTSTFHLQSSFSPLF